MVARKNAAIPASADVTLDEKWITARLRVYDISSDILKIMKAQAVERDSSGREIGFLSKEDMDYDKGGPKEFIIKLL